MTKEQTYLLTVLQKAVRGETVGSVPADAPDWPALIREAENHAVWLPVYDALEPVQAQVFTDTESTELAAMGRYGSNVRVEQAQLELVAVLDRLSCPYVILKGLSSSAWYPKPHTRHLGDVDFLVPQQWLERAKNTLVQSGYAHVLHPGSHHHNLQKRGVKLEMHMQIAGLPEQRGRDGLQAFFADIYEQRQLVKTDTGSFYAPGDAHQAVIQLLHIRHHLFSGGIGLRHVMDWACFMNRNGEKPFWQAQVLPLMRQAGLLHFTAAVTKLAAVYMGSVCPAWAECEEDLCRDLMEDILTGGNFGCKDLRRNHCFGLFPDWEGQSAGDGKLARLYKNLRRTVLQQHPKLKNRPVATFFCMGYKAARYTVLRVFGKRPALSEVAVLARQREAVYSRLWMPEKDGSCDN